MILHCVFFSFRDVLNNADQQVVQDFAEHCLAQSGITAFDFGPNRDFEHKSANYSDGFVVAFEDKSALYRYAEDPKHIEFGRWLCECCIDGADGIMVFDIDTAKRRS